MAEQPSYMTSTTSQILIVGVVGYVLICGWMAVKGQVAEALTGMRWLVEAMLVLYGYRKGVEVGKNGGTNGQAPPATP